MAEKFQPQTFDINSINKGDKFTLSDGIEPKAVNAPIEAAAYIQSLATNQPNIENANKIGTPKVSIELAPNGTPRFKFEELKGEKGQDGTDHSVEIQQINAEQLLQNEKIEETKKEVHNIKQALLQNEVLVVSKIPNKTTTRITAGGENIVDDQYTAVKEIKGSTVRCENYLDLPRTSTWTTRMDIVVNLPAGTYTLSVSKSTTGGGSAPVIAVSVDGTNLALWTSTVEKRSITFTVLGGKYTFYFYANGYSYNDSIGITSSVYEAMLNAEKEARTWQPYFTDLKRANIEAIKSTGRNLLPYPYTNGTSTSGGVTYTVNDNQSITVKGNSTGASAFILFRQKNFFPIGTYSYKAYGLPEGMTANIQLYDGGTWVKNLATDSRNGCTFSITESDLQYSVVVNVYVVQAGSTIDATIRPMLNYGGTVKEYEPYTEDIYELPQELINLYPNGIPEYDRFIPQTGELIRQTGYATSETGFTEEEIAGYDGAIVSSDKLSLEYKLSTPTTEKIENAPKLYKAWNKGRESVIQGDTDNSIYGAMPTVTNEYILKIGGETE